MQQRIILIHQTEKLSEHCQGILLEFLKGSPTHVDFIFDALSLSAKDEFAAQLRQIATVTETKKGAKENVFDMCRLIFNRKQIEALQILDALLSEAHPLQIMGGMVWAWGKERSRMPSARFQKGLHELQEADVSIKRSRMRPEVALEILVVKLCGN